MHRLRLTLVALAAAGLLLLPLPAALAIPPEPAAASAADVGPEEWRLPVPAALVTAPFVAPAHAYGPGHRGVDVASGSGSSDVLAAADGTVAFAGPVAGRGVITIDHGDGWVTSVEPVESTVAVGDVVIAGDTWGPAIRASTSTRSRWCGRSRLRCSSPAATDQAQARGCACRYAAWRRSVETWV
jgi:murein DD-endopeptidase MepM/ murein hydrolase activator NlpD